ncbi:alpha/beta hydrolase [Shewanella eurypsychrophilus]|uniref:Alpha/beta hydrolase n=1 Tax=Shewanella eurypsychrophilus TaxID=2593656 RepID=A0ABX6V5D5_9GAMM|nr:MULTISPECIES: alpha/beta hydrolase [Shewanella]QFU22550.1 alpha/beta fold hydrolase [Shewanella sp. YLB-09]QPG57839.1 alpha/beta hydrolase [Shewanella eurypsychrophilus]
MRHSSAEGKEIEFQLPHIRLSGRHWGRADKPLLLALHGWLDNANSFEPLAKHLQDYQILAIDWPGHGFSEHRPGAYPLHWIDYLYDLEILIDRISEQQTLAGLIGHSLGGIVAAAYTAAFPERVTKLVLMEAVSPLFESASKNNQRLRTSFVSHLRWAKKRAALPTVYDSIEVAIKARSRLTGLEEKWCRLLVERNMQQHDIGVSWRSDPRLKLDSPIRLTFEQVDALMTDHDVETLLITADAGYEQITTLLPKAEVWFNRLCHVQISGDHHLHMGNARAVSESIDLFMSQ